MMKNYMTIGTLTKGKRHEGDSVGKVVTPFHEEMAAMSIYGGPFPHESWCKLKLIGQAINVVSTMVLEYLC
jgi:hypothetical protein